MTVITISRELGCQGDLIVDMLCEKLGYARVDRDVLMQIAEEAGVDPDAILAIERGVTQRARLVSDEMTSLYRKQTSAFEQKRAIDDETYRRLVRETMERYAREGNVIFVGRAGQMVLRDWSGALHVRLWAAEEVRAQRLSEREGISEAEAARRIRSSDEQKRQYIRYMHQNADWRNLKYYNLVIDTARIPPEVAVEIIIKAL